MKIVKRPHNFIDLTNKVFGSLYVEGISNKKLSKVKSNYWKCACNCGNKILVVTSSLTSGRTKSCGCLRSKRPAPNRQYVGDITGLFWAHIKFSAKSRNIDFLITKEQAWSLFLKQNKKCVYTNKDLYFKKYICKENGKDKYSKGNASLDRIDSKLPYTIDNIQWVHKDINWLKNKFSEECFIDLCISVAENHGRKKCL